MCYNKTAISDIIILFLSHVIIAFLLSLGSQLPCFTQGVTTIQSMRDRFHMNLTEDQLAVHVLKLIDDSVQSLTTRLYDSFQYFTNGIL